MHISDIVRRKGSEVVTLTPGTPVRELLTVLAERRLGAVVVSSDGALVEGIVSERDVVRALAHLGPRILDQQVADLMTVDVFTCAPEDTLDGLARTMTERRFRHVPVVTDGQLVGLVSIGDVVRERIEELETERGHLESYVASAR